MQSATRPFGNGAFAAEAPSASEGIPAGNLGEAPEIVVAGQDFVDTVLESQCDQVGVVNEVARHGGLLEDFRQYTFMFRGFGNDPDGWGSQEQRQSLERFGRGGWGVENPMMGHHPQELIEARPEQDVGCTPFTQSAQQGCGLAVIGCPLAMCVYEDVRVERDHALSPVHQIEELVSIVQVDSG